MQKISFSITSQTADMNKKFLLLFSSGILFLAILAFTSPAKTENFTCYNTDTTAPLTIKAKDHKGRSVVSTSGVITFTTGLHNDYYQVDSTNKTGYLYVEAKLGKFLNNNVKRVPLNISIVIDRSGSMEGIKMGYAKKAAKGIIDQLKPEDFVSIVIYDHAVDTLQSPVNAIDKEKIKAKIDKITARGSTNLWGGTEQGYEYVKKNYNQGFINRVLLISDGLANVGLTDSTLIRIKVQKFKDDEGISLSTFGVGLDYNETLMTDMAETGAGNYYFIHAADKLADIFDKEMNGLMSVAAQNAELKINLPKGIKIERGYPLKFQPNGDEITVKLRDLSSEETKATIFTFSINNNVNAVLKFTTNIFYTDVTDGQQKTLTNENILSPIKNVDAYLTHFNRQVIEQTILFTANEKLETAMNLMEKGDHNAARKYIAENSAYLKANSTYVSGYDDLMRMDSLNTNYQSIYYSAASVSADSVKKIQKASKAENYKLRNKKQ